VEGPEDQTLRLVRTPPSNSLNFQGHPFPARSGIHLVRRSLVLSSSKWRGNVGQDRGKFPGCLQAELAAGLAIRGTTIQVAGGRHW